MVGPRCLTTTGENVKIFMGVYSDLSFVVGGRLYNFFFPGFIAKISYNGNILSIFGLSEERLQF